MTMKSQTKTNLDGRIITNETLAAVWQYNETM